MEVILDTNALSDFASGDPLLGRLLGTIDALALPSIVLGEYRFGLAASRHRKVRKAWLAARERDCRVLKVDGETARHYAEVRSELKARGTPIPENDVWIAALARQHVLPVVSRDSHFDQVRGLRRLVW
jgi:tRNA(fMet)-specific endonuclease VapC